jgi:hypothetical protein
MKRSTWPHIATSKHRLAGTLGADPSAVAKEYRRRAKDCCRKAVIVEDIDQRSHWLEAAARWYSLAREMPVRTSKTLGSVGLKSWYAWKRAE